MRRGTSLLEAVASCALLGLLLVSIFAIFRMGSSSFSLSVMRQGLEGEARRVTSWLQRDVRRTVATSTTLAAGRVSDGHRRDGICLPTLADWNAPTSYSSANGLPDWDRYLVYYATLERPLGRMIRVEYDPGPGKAHSAWAAFDPARHLCEDPATNQDMAPERRWSSLSSQVEEFTLGTDGAMVTVQLRLRGQEGSRWHQGPRREEIFEAQLEIRPQNQEP